MSEQNLRTFWLSFANEDEFGGVVVVDLCRYEIDPDDEGPVFSAVHKSIRLGLNPGQNYSVQGQELPPDEIPAQFKHRLLGAADVEQLNSQATH